MFTTFEQLESRVLMASGLRSTYFDKINLSGTRESGPVATVDFDWGSGSPDPNIDANTFSARWQGKIQPRFAELYTFFLNIGDGGARLWIGGELVIDAWNSAGAQNEYEGTIALQADLKFDLKVEYYDRVGAASAQLLWSSESQAKEVVPTSRLFLGPKPVKPDTIVEVTTSNPTASEPGSNLGSFTIRRETGSTNSALDVFYMLEGTAKNGEDFQILGDSITIDAGKRNRKVTIQPIDDDIVESVENVRIVLIGSTDYAVKSPKDKSEVTISDNDVPPPVVTLSVQSGTATEAGEVSAVVRVTRDGNAAGDLAVLFSLDGDAIEGTDYDSLTHELTIPDGLTFADVTIVPKDDTEVEIDESLGVTLTASENYVIGAEDQASINFVSDDVVRTIDWDAGIDNPQKRFEAPAVVVEGRVYIFGGWFWDNQAEILRASQRLDVFDAATQQWVAGADSLPTKLTHQALVVDGDRIYNIGGFVGDDPGVADDDIWMYDISEDDWFEANFELPEERGGGGAALIGRRLHYFGGSNPDRVSDSGAHWSIDLDNTAGGWTTEPDMPNPRHHFSTAVLDGMIYVIGGQHEHDTLPPVQDKTVHRYDPVAGEWTQLNDLPEARSHAEPGTFLMNGRIVIAGGIDVNRDPLASIIEYDAETDTWRSLFDMPQGLKAPVVQFLDGNLFLTSGEGDDNGPQDETWLGEIASL